MTDLQIRSVAGARRGRRFRAGRACTRATGSIESDYLNGEICLLGRRHGIATPVNDLLQEMTWDAARRSVAPGSLPVSALLDRLPAPAG